MKKHLLMGIVFLSLSVASCQKEASLLPPPNVTITESSISTATKESKIPTLITSCTSCAHGELIFISGENYKPMKDIWIEVDYVDLPPFEGWVGNYYTHLDANLIKSTSKGAISFTHNYPTPARYPGVFRVRTVEEVNVTGQKIQTEIAVTFFTVNAPTN